MYLNIVKLLNNNNNIYSLNDGKRTLILRQFDAIFIGFLMFFEY